MLYLFNYLAIFCARTSQKIKALLRAKMQINTIHYKSSTNMAELKDNSIKLIITSPPYFNIKDYSQNKENYNENDIGNIDNYSLYSSNVKNMERVRKSITTKWKIMYKCAFNANAKKPTKYTLQSPYLRFK